MNSDQLDDLKQFISMSISQSEERLRAEIQAVCQEMADGFLGEAIPEIHQHMEKTRCYS